MSRTRGKVWKDRRSGKWACGVTEPHSTHSAIDIVGIDSWNAAIAGVIAWLSFGRMAYAFDAIWANRMHEPWQ